MKVRVIKNCKAMFLQKYWKLIENANKKFQKNL
jgi:hypothetical protein